MTNERFSLPTINQEIKRTWRRTRQDYSAGGVVYRRSPLTQELQLALIATHGGQRWQLPKGSREPGETSLATAIREVAEETGIESVQDAFLQTIDYWYWDTYQKEVPELVHKLVDFYLLRMVAGELTDSSYEVDAVGWFAPTDALRIMTFEGEKAVVRQALDLLAGLG
ncbi:MAG: NUDIX hydrolase [Caldilineaceae bacterium]|nr:NUDIX hydrolase [Caldilineaceae bacterium]